MTKDVGVMSGGIASVINYGKSTLILQHKYWVWCTLQNWKLIWVQIQL